MMKKKQVLQQLVQPQWDNEEALRDTSSSESIRHYYVGTIFEMQKQIERGTALVKIVAVPKDMSQTLRLSVQHYMYQYTEYSVTVLFKDDIAWKVFKNLMKTWNKMIPELRHYTAGKLFGYSNAEITHFIKKWVYQVGIVQ